MNVSNYDWRVAGLIFEEGDEGRVRDEAFGKFLRGQSVYPKWEDLKEGRHYRDWIRIGFMSTQRCFGIRERDQKLLGFSLDPLFDNRIPRNAAPFYLKYDILLPMSDGRVGTAHTTTCKHAADVDGDTVCSSCQHFLPLYKNKLKILVETRRKALDAGSIISVNANPRFIESGGEREREIKKREAGVIERKRKRIPKGLFASEIADGAFDALPPIVKALLGMY